MNKYFPTVNMVEEYIFLLLVDKNRVVWRCREEHSGMGEEMRGNNSYWRVVAPVER